jgi:hypothetical protein
MLRNWTEVLPLFIVRHLAQTKCETIRQNGLLVKVPRPGVMIQIEALPKEGDCVNSRRFSVC